MYVYKFELFSQVSDVAHEPFVYNELHPRMFYSYSFVSYDDNTYVGLNSRLLRSREFRARDTKIMSIFTLSIEKNQ